MQSRFGAGVIKYGIVNPKASAAAIDKAFEKGYAQVEKYTSDKNIMAMLTLGNSFKAGVLVFVGLKNVLFRPWPKPAPGAKKIRQTKRRVDSGGR